MCRTFRDQGTLFSYVPPESRVPANHPLRKIRGGYAAHKPAYPHFGPNWG